jgi:antitoxin (DNA-binding transcriptional repressor) of toxin-antitoxin stability system
MKARISASELGRELAKVLDRVRREGQSYLIEQDGEAIASLEPTEVVRSTTWHTLEQALDDLPDTDVDFVADLGEVQREQSDIPAIMWPIQLDRHACQSGYSATARWR